MNVTITEKKELKKERHSMSLADFGKWLISKQYIDHEDTDHSWREAVDRRLAVLEFATKIQIAGIFTTGAGVFVAVLLEILTN